MIRVVTRPFARMLDAAQRRFRRARPGSVLIMVVSLLVLLALIGTAAISTARIDRASSRQHVANVQIDLLIEGLKNLVIGDRVTDLYAANPTGSAVDTPAADAMNPSDALVGSRLPEPLVVPNAATIAQYDQAIPVGWRHVSFPPFGTNGSWYYEPPYLDPSASTAPGALGLPKADVLYQPTSIKIRGVDFPAFNLLDAGNRNVLGGPYLAADSDGDGIADAILVRLPISPISGVTYYAAVRVIDHNSALNVNTAGDANLEQTRTTTPFSIAGWYPFSTSLFWEGDTSRPAPIRAPERAAWVARLVPGGGFGSDVTGLSFNPFSQADPSATGATARSDFAFLSNGDVFWNQLGRRLENPGYNSTVDQFGYGVRPFSIGDGIALARRFILKDGSAPGSTIETVFPGSTFNSAVALPYPPGAVPAWFNNNFDYASMSFPGVHSRPLLTTFNPTRNYVEHKPGYAAIAYDTGTVPPAGSPAGAAVPEGLYRARANLNTATFGELMQAFYDVMAETDGGTDRSPFDDAAAWAVTDAYQGTKFAAAKPFTADATMHPAAMFRSPLRWPTGVTNGARLHPWQTVVLRSAIAAANAEALRGSPDGEPVAHQVAIPAPKNVTGAQAFSATVYGLKRQPFLTEIYINNDSNFQPPPTPPGGGPGGGGPGGGGAPDDPVPPPPATVTRLQNPAGLVIVELYNPYDAPIALTNFKLRTIDRSKWPTLQYEKLKTADGKDVSDGLLSAKTIPANGYLVIHNFKDGVTDQDSAQYLPKLFLDADKAKLADGAGVLYLPGIQSIMDPTGAGTRELVLVRELAGKDLIPIDSFDATGIPLLTPVPKTPADKPVGPAKSWHYARSTGDATRPWHFVYPGRYDGSQTGRRHQGTIEAQWHPEDPATDTGEPKPGMGEEVTIGAGSNDSTRKDVSEFAIPILDDGVPGPFKTGTPKAFPFGGFARAGDVVHVPFVGTYIVRPDGANGPAGVGTFTEANAVTLDSVFAEDTDTADDKKTGDMTDPQPEDIGRFAPRRAELGRPTVTGKIGVVTGAGFEDLVRREATGFFDGYNCVIKDATGTFQVRRVSSYTWTKAKGGTVTLATAFAPAPVAGVAYRLESAGSYGWARDVMDYFTTIASPADDYLPQADPVGNPTGTQPHLVRNVSDPLRYANRPGFGTAPPVGPRGELVEDGAPTEGLVNINTASWKVLASLPLVMQTTGTKTTVNRDATERLAKRIVYFRDVAATADPGSLPWGPFRSIMELNNVPGFNFETAEGTLATGANSTDPEPATKDGDYTPIRTSPGGPESGLRGGYEQRYLNVARISNLVTLRSDAYTAYIMVQGWRDPGTPAAALVAQRRMAFMIDRSRLSPTVTGPNKTPAVYMIPAGQ